MSLFSFGFKSVSFFLPAFEMEYDSEEKWCQKRSLRFYASQCIPFNFFLWKKNIYLVFGLNFVSKTYISVYPFSSSQILTFLIEWNSVLIHILSNSYESIQNVQWKRVRLNSFKISIPNRFEVICQRLRNR